MREIVRYSQDSRELPLGTIDIAILDRIDIAILETLQKDARRIQSGVNAMPAHDGWAKPGRS
ncbi:hypothetical protein EN745_09375 [Mesorhizobium sp. M4A.F.Ca.ET.022.05.2.1]|uniref:hypothetical protein n=1 Tax=Mesorhizobium sp. M4A.F.Ca.ET.022.05.2.1 TaxID=2496653 RepID=UPI000FCAF6CA|nr:hypothetical protein [Mesorhizobium sp. M4A.F.Ca.ET.022.05.2.1]RVC81606.1 hypothetical protein EN745_09375 [Mesorhizobium sp. M4A.F.Ca.ET.022.05.2.1]